MVKYLSNTISGWLSVDYYRKDKPKSCRGRDEEIRTSNNRLSQAYRLPYSVHKKRKQANTEEVLSNLISNSTPSGTGTMPPR